MTKIDLITGILGAGKTTFLRQYAAYFIRQGQKIAILENDFGAVNADMILLQDLKGENCQLEMITGGGDPDCHKRRFKTQLISLGMQHLDRVIMEPSGIYDMDEFFDTLYEPPLDRWFTIGSILTIVDATMPKILSTQMEYLLASEAACAGKLIVSKLPHTNDYSKKQLTEHLLQHLNRALSAIQCRRQFVPADLLLQEWDTLTDADFCKLLSAGYRNESYVKQFHTEELPSEVQYFLHLQIPQAQIQPVLQQILADPACGDIDRIKGSLLSESSGWLKINVTSEKTDIAPVPEGQAVLIVIGERLNREQIDAYLRAVNTDPGYVSI